jgi:hypothetical protein
MLGLLALAGCTVNNPVQELVRQRRAADPFRAAGFSQAPFALSPGGIGQLLDLLSGVNSVPRELWRFCYAGAWHTPKEPPRADAVVAEISTLTEYRLGGLVLNANIVADDLSEALAAMPGMDAKAVRAWKNALGKCKDDLRREAAAAILARHPSDTDAQRIAREVIEGVRTTPAPLEEIERAISRIREAFAGARMGLSLHRFQYMSQARALDWPPELNKEVHAVAGRLSLPLFDGAVLVAQHGNAKALAADCRTWADAFVPVVADALDAFVHSFAGSADAA